MYEKHLGNLLKFQKKQKNLYNAYHLFVIEIDQRKKLYDYLKKNGIITQIHYIPVHKLPYYAKIGYEESDLIFSEKYYNKCLSLPMYPTLSTEEQKFIIKKILEFHNLKHE